MGSEMCIRDSINVVKKKHYASQQTREETNLSDDLLHKQACRIYSTQVNDWGQVHAMGIDGWFRREAATEDLPPQTSAQETESAHNHKSGRKSTGEHAFGNGLAS